MCFEAICFDDVASHPCLENGCRTNREDGASVSACLPPKDPSKPINNNILLLLCVLEKDYVVPLVGKKALKGF